MTCEVGDDETGTADTGDEDELAPDCEPDVAGSDTDGAASGGLADDESD